MLILEHCLPGQAAGVSSELALGGREGDFRLLFQSLVLPAVRLLTHTCHRQLRPTQPGGEGTAADGPQPAELKGQGPWGPEARPWGCHAL